MRLSLAEMVGAFQRAHDDAREFHAGSAVNWLKPAGVAVEDAYGNRPLHCAVSVAVIVPLRSVLVAGKPCERQRIVARASRVTGVSGAKRL